MPFLKKTYVDTYPKHVLNDDGTIGKEGFSVGLTQSWITDVTLAGVPLLSIDLFFHNGEYHVRTWELETLSRERVFTIEDLALAYVARHIQVLSKTAFPG